MDLMNVVLPLLILATFYFFIIRPQNKVRKDQETFAESLKKGMTVVTTSGIHGTINKIEGDIVHLQVDSKTYIKFSRSAISRELTAQAYKKEEVAKTKTA